MIHFEKNSDNQYVLVVSGKTYQHFKFVAAFPIERGTEHCISVLNEHEKEIAWIEDLSQLPEFVQELVLSEIGRNPVFFEIKSIEKISSRLYPSEWTVQTNHGPFQFWIDCEEDFIILKDDLIMIRSNIKKIFILRHVQQMDKKSILLLRPFLFLA
jgi:hypothetical protein